MGWTGSETSIPLGMIFRKMYCFKCGTKFKKKKITVYLKKGDKGFTKQIAGITTIGMDKLKKSHYEYKCPNCNLEISYYDQCKVVKVQKELKKQILTKEELEMYDLIDRIENLLM